MGKDCKGTNCCGACDLEVEKIDISSLGPEAVELDKLFDEVNQNLINALRLRKKIIETIHVKSIQSQTMKEKMEKVVKSQHPVLVQFVFGESKL